MTIITKSRLKKAAEKAGISIGSGEGKPYATLKQLEAFAVEFQLLCAAKCLAIAEKHQQVEGSRASAMKAGALECHAALSAK